MRIAYVLHWNEFFGSGVWEKVYTQIAHWRAAGCEPEIHLVTREDRPHVNTGDVPLFVYVAKGYANQLAAWSRLRAIVSQRKPDAAYLRYDVPNLEMLRLLSEVRTIVEVNTNDVEEFWSASWKKGLVNVALRGALLKRAAGIIGVTRALSNIVPPAAKAVPFTVIANGIDLDRYESLPSGENVSPAFLFVASAEHAWQGLDRLLRLAELLPDRKFHVVGVGSPAVAPTNVEFHGRLDRQGIAKVARHCDVGIGTLALFRKSADEASPLKVREYLALGLPVVGGYQDTDFPKGADHFLKIENSERGVELDYEAIAEFAMRWLGRRVPRSLVMEVDARAKELNRLAFIRRVL